MLRIKLVKSPVGHNIRNRRTIIALGLHKVHQVVEQPDNPSIRGMIQHVHPMLQVEVVEGEAAPKKAPKQAAPKAAPKSTESAEKPAAKPKKAPAKADDAPKPKRAPKRAAEENE